MSAALHVVVLAAGQGTRMRSTLPKVLHPIGGQPMLARVLACARALEAQRIHVVIGPGGEALRAPFSHDSDIEWVTQTQALGTGHALAQALPGIPDSARVLVLYGDVPLIKASTLVPLTQAQSLALLVARVADPSGYGRLLRAPDGAVAGIVEHADASPEQRSIQEVNTGILAGPASSLKRWTAALNNDNAKREYYLTDSVAMAVAESSPVVAVAAADPTESEGVNDPEQLARAERRFQRRQASELLREGLFLADPERFDLRGSLTHGRDVFIDVGCVLIGTLSLADGVRIGPHCVLRDVRVGPGSRIEAHSVLDGAVIGPDCSVGPFARLRPGSELAAGVHIGNFVEVKQARLGPRTKAGHLAYLGDASIGADVNISAGVITCNYDGANKHLTTIGDGAFIGSDSQLIAPIVIGERAYIAAGSTITLDAPADQLTLRRAREQRSIPGWKRPQKG